MTLQVSSNCDGSTILWSLPLAAESSLPYVETYCIKTLKLNKKNQYLWENGPVAVSQQSNDDIQWPDRSKTAASTRDSRNLAVAITYTNHFLTGNLSAHLSAYSLCCSVHVFPVIYPNHELKLVFYVDTVKLSWWTKIQGSMQHWCSAVHATVRST